MSQDQDKVLNHAYDGIQEYDNPLPGWWKWIFIITMVHSAGYLAYYHLGGPGTSPQEDYTAEMAVYNEQQAAIAALAPKVDAESLSAVLANATEVAAGKVVYEGKCVACHGAKGEGLVGPNLTDNFWIHGAGELTDIYKVVEVGVPEKGMIAWKSLLQPKEMMQVVAYVKTLEGTYPPNPKAPQGNPVGGTAVAADGSATATPVVNDGSATTTAVAAPAGNAG